MNVYPLIFLVEVKMDRKEFAFENDYVKIINPTKEQEQEITEVLKKYAKEDDNGVVSAYHILCKLSIPKDDKYDFSKYSIEEFTGICEEIHMYDGMQEILNEVALISTDITIHELQYIALGLKHQRIQLLMSVIEDETNNLNELGREIYNDKKEINKLKELSDVYKEKRKIQKEVNSLVGDIE
jgi:hypothetical protein